MKTSHLAVSPPPVFEPFGPTTRRRQVAGALVIMAGAIPIALIAPTFYGRPPRLWSVILTIGVVATVAWLVDGRRYLGVAAAALGIGGGFTIASEAEVQDYQFALLFGLLGAGLLVVRAVNPAAVGASAGLLLLISASATTFVSIDRTGFPEAWFYVPLMLVWGGIQLARALGTVPPSSSTAVSGTASAVVSTGGRDRARRG